MHEWLGDSLARWDGDTLIVDTTNYKARAFQNISSEKLHITERYVVKMRTRFGGRLRWTTPTPGRNPGV